MGVSGQVPLRIAYVVAWNPAVPKRYTERGSFRALVRLHAIATASQGSKHSFKMNHPSLPHVRDYLNGPFQQVQGWCMPQLWQTIQPLAQAVSDAGGNGPIAEIGVYHGKFFIGLVKTMMSAKPNYAIDVFDLQQFNLDNAGIGDLAKFKENLEISNVPESSVRFERTDSMWLTRADADRIRAESGGFAMFSIDGCHLAEHTINDLLFAMEVTLPQGVILIDDYYNADWPGVQEGVAKFYLSHTARFVPLVATCNKLVLCNLSYHKIYLNAVGDFVRKNHPQTRVKAVKRFGFDTLTISPNHLSTDYIKS